MYELSGQGGAPRLRGARAFGSRAGHPVGTPVSPAKHGTGARRRRLCRKRAEDSTAARASAAAAAAGPTRVTARAAFPGRGRRGRPRPPEPDVEGGEGPGLDHERHRAPRRRPRAGRPGHVVRGEPPAERDEADGPAGVDAVATGEAVRRLSRRPPGREAGGMALAIRRRRGRSDRSQPDDRRLAQAASIPCAMRGASRDASSLRTSPAPGAPPPARRSRPRSGRAPRPSPRAPAP